MAVLAGQYGPENMTFSDGSSAANTFFEIKNLDDTLAEIWLEPNKIVPAMNPLKTDGLGNIYFYADPGRYRIYRDGTLLLSVIVSRHPSEAISDEDKNSITEEVLAELEPSVSFEIIYQNARS